MTPSSASIYSEAGDLFLQEAEKHIMLPNDFQSFPELQVGGLCISLVISTLQSKPDGLPLKRKHLSKKSKKLSEKVLFWLTVLLWLTYII